MIDMIDGLQFHHIGVATSDIENTAAQYGNFGYEMDGSVTFDPQQNINICFLKHPSMPLVELLAPADDKSPVVQILNKNGVTPYHVCYSVKDLEEAIKALRKLRYMIVSRPKPACAIGGRRVAFLYHKDMGLIELVEE
ncbi:MAG: VOC family protein [Muribaculaceae bacterium]